MLGTERALRCIKQQKEAALTDVLLLKRWRKFNGKLTLRAFVLRLK
jgi:hypothetical protein